MLLFNILCTNTKEECELEVIALHIIMTVVEPVYCVRNLLLAKFMWQTHANDHHLYKGKICSHYWTLQRFIQSFLMALLQHHWGHAQCYCRISWSLSRGTHVHSLAASKQFPMIHINTPGVTFALIFVVYAVQLATASLSMHKPFLVSISTI